jgi:D-alanyl-D-alanine endopeptidase (penicillin-binding protein 7)
MRFKLSAIALAVGLTTLSSAAISERFEAPYLYNGPGITEFYGFEKLQADARDRQLVTDLVLMRANVVARYVYVVDAATGLPVFEKDIDRIVPIASITKLMTAIVVLDDGSDLNELITITNADVKWLKVTRSKLNAGMTLPRGELLRLALMSSDNRAAVALARTSPGGVEGFVARMNAKANQLYMSDTHYDDPTGLTPTNVSTARDLVRMLEAASDYDEIREFSTTEKYRVTVGVRKTGKRRGDPIVVKYSNSNPLIHNDTWKIEMSKTGYIRDAGRCLVMRATVAAREMYIVLLNSKTKLSRVRDAITLRTKLETQ